tara:strand:- start:2936 stop:3313 length:378 start_codon:yes stop_codon:yes gene_type:complete
MENFINLSQRQLRVGEQVRQIISNFLLKDIVLDNYLTNASVTVSRVRMSKDLKIAYVYVMPLGGSNIEKVKKALDINKSIFQKELGKKIKNKFTPKLIFYIDDTFLEAKKINDLLSIDKVKKDLS